MEIKQLVEASQKTRREIIAHCGFSQGYLSLLERGERQVGVKHLAKLADALGVDPGVLRPDLAKIFGCEAA